MPRKSQNLKKQWKNITIHEEEEKALLEFQKKLAKHLQFQPTLSQTLRWLIAHAERLLQ